MVVNGKQLISLEPIKKMKTDKIVSPVGVSFGLSEAGYDIRVKQEIKFIPKGTKISVPYYIKGIGSNMPQGHTTQEGPLVITDNLVTKKGNFVLASAIEEFDMPPGLVGVVHDKSTWARKGLSVFNTVIEPGWKGFLTLELVYHGSEVLIIPAGSGIAQVIFHEVSMPSRYSGKYQNQPDEPTEGIFT